MSCLDEYKQVIVVRTDLEMSRGKLAVQVAHASVLAAFKTYNEKPEWFKKWWESGMKKIVLKVNNERELLEIYSNAMVKNLPVVLIKNAGLTELEPGTLTAVGIGPAPSNIIDTITGGLKTL